MKKWVLVIGVVAFGLPGCKDKAKEPYAKCVQLDVAGDVKGAWDACNAAVAADPNSTSGKAATAKLAGMKAKYQAWKKADDEKQARAAEQRRKADEAAQQAAQAAAAQRMAQLKQKVSKKYWDAEPDSDCTGKGLPPYRWDYSGGTYAEDQEVAEGDGCTKLYQFVEIQDYCCPQKPNTFGL